MPTGNMISSLIKGGLHTYAFFTNIFPTMTVPNCNDFMTLLSHNLRNDIASFVSSHYQSAMLSPTPIYNLQQHFQVTSVGLKNPIEHEYLIIWVSDMKTEKTHEFVIERGPSYILTLEEKLSSFSRCSESTPVLNSIKSAIGKLGKSFSAESDNIPLLADTDSPSADPPSYVLPMIPPFLDHPFADFSPADTATPSLSFDIDSITTSFASALTAARTGSESVSPRCLAQDSILGQTPGTSKKKGCICLFNPVGLSLFDIALLTLVVHEYSPIYGLFDNQCFMFTSVIFDSIIQLYSTHPNIHDPSPSSFSTSSTSAPAPTSDVNPPSDADIVSLPTRAGRWLGLLIVDPIIKQTIVGIVIGKFKDSRKAYMDGFQVPTYTQ
jgi:hypothetical protein